VSPGNSENQPAEDPFAQEDPLDAVLPPPPAPEAGSDSVEAEAAGDEDFDALGFDTGFGAAPGGLGDEDETPPGGIYVGEDVQVLDASAVGRALAEADGEVEEGDVPDLGALQAGLVGVDIGAAAAAVARFDENGAHEIVPNEDDELLTPVQIFFDEDGEQIVGREARLMAASAPSRAVVDLKAAISDPAFRVESGGDGPDGGQLDAEAVLALFLRRLLDGVDGDVTHVALAAPAWFGDEQRARLRRAAEQLEGVELVGITDECLAAAVPYSLRLPDLNPRTALVFDLGHAALGVGVVRCGQGDIAVLAQDARQELGSARWGALLAEEAARKFAEANGSDPLEDEAARVDLYLRAEDAKRALSARAQCTLVVSCGGKTMKVGFSRRGFEEAARGLLDESLALARAVRDQAGLSSWEEIDALILTGGGAKTPAVRRALQRETGREPERGIGMEESVAVGALYWGIGERHRRESGA